MESSTPDRLRAATLWRSAIRGCGMVGVLLAFLPSAVYQGGVVRTEAERAFVLQNPDAQPFRSDFTLGWPSSPLIRRFSEATLIADGGAGVTLRRTNGVHFDLLSWSMASLAVGVLLLWATRTERSETSGSPIGRPGATPH